MPFLRRYNTPTHLIFILPSSPLLAPSILPFSCDFPFPSGLEPRASSCALVGKRKSSLPFGSWNQFRKYLVPTMILPKPPFCRHIGSYGQNEGSAFAFVSPARMPRKNTGRDPRSNAYPPAISLSLSLSLSVVKRKFLIRKMGDDRRLAEFPVRTRLKIRGLLLPSSTRNQR